MQKDNRHSPGKLFWLRFRKNKLALGALSIILSSILVSVLGYIIIPDKTPHADSQILEISTRKPGFKVQLIAVRKNVVSEKENFFKRMFNGEKSDYTLIPISTYKFEASNIIITEYTELDEDPFLKTFSIADIVYPIAYNTPIIENAGDLKFTDIHGTVNTLSIKELQDQITKENIYTKRFLLGTDRFGRDLLSRLVLGTRISLSVGIISVSISLLIGITLGAIAGYYRGKTDDIIMWLINVIWSIPTLLMVIAITLVVGKGFWVIFVAVGLTMWVEVARVVRGQVISIREKEYIEAARALAFSDFRIIFKHILPNIINPVIIISAANFATAILLEAGLSFLGIGVQPPIPSWGSMIKQHYGFIIMDKAYLAILPGLAIMIMVLSFTLIGNALRDAFDTKNP